MKTLEQICAGQLQVPMTAYHCGLEVGRYISLERIIEENKERYYETLRLSSQGWHEGRHDPCAEIPRRGLPGRQPARPA